jgi:hypothetical protein
MNGPNRMIFRLALLLLLAQVRRRRNDMICLRRVVLLGSLVFGLCSCASSYDLQSSFSIDGMTAPSMDVRNPRFYMDDREMAPVLSNPNFILRPADAESSPLNGAR